MLIFTYGTLKRGHSNHRLLTGSRFICEATTEPRYRLYDCGYYPCMVADEVSGVGVTGEVFEVDPAVLANLDRLEGHPTTYRRQRISIADGAFSDPVEAYVYQQSVNGMNDLGATWNGSAPVGADDDDDDDDDDA